MKRVVSKLMVLGVMAILASCAGTKDVTYLQDADEFEVANVSDVAQVRARKGDVINIFVSSRNAESAMPFNLTAFGYRPGSGNSDVFSSQQRPLGYTVDEAGNIDFPRVGTLHVESLTRMEIKELVKEKLVKGDFLKDPIVTVEFQNLKITVLGEVAHPGSYAMNNDHTTLLEALGMAGDLTIYGRRDHVAVIREVDGKRTIVYHDLKSKQIFDSPRYYLQQNDIVYVEPNKAKASQSDQTRWNQPSVWISIISTVISIVTLIKVLA